MTHSFTPFLFIVAFLIIGAPSKAQAEPGGEWGIARIGGERLQDIRL